MRWRTCFARGSTETVADRAIVAVVEAPTLTGEAVTLRQLVADDVAPLVEIVGSPAVARWWGPHDSAAVEEWIAADDEIHWTVEIEGEVAGMVQASEELGAAFRHAGIDLFLAAEHHGRGLGAQTVRLVAPGSSASEVITA